MNIKARQKKIKFMSLSCIFLNSLHRKKETNKQIKKQKQTKKATKTIPNKTDLSMKTM